MTTRFQLTNISNIRKGDTLIRFVAGKPAPIGQVIIIQPQREGAILLITDEGHRIVGQPSQMIMKGCK